MFIQELKKVTHGKMHEIKAVAERTGELHEGISQKSSPLGVAINQREQEEGSKEQVGLRVAEADRGRRGAPKDVKGKSGNADDTKRSHQDADQDVGIPSGEQVGAGPYGHRATGG